MRHFEDSQIIRKESNDLYFEVTAYEEPDNRCSAIRTYYQRKRLPKEASRVVESVQAISFIRKGRSPKITFTKYAVGLGLSIKTATRMFDLAKDRHLWPKLDQMAELIKSRVGRLWL